MDQRSSARGFVCRTGNEAVSRANCVLNGKNDRQHQSLYQWNKFHLEFWNLVRSVANQFYQSFFRFENTPAFPIWYEVPSLKWKNGRACICLLLQPSRFKLNFHVKNQLKCKELLACNRSSSPNILKRFWTPGCVINRSDKDCQRGATAGRSQGSKRSGKAAQMHRRINASGHQCCQYPRTALVATPASRIEYFMPVSWWP